MVISLKLVLDTTSGMNNASQVNDGLPTSHKVVGHYAPCGGRKPGSVSKQHELGWLGLKPVFDNISVILRRSGVPGCLYQY